MPIGLSIKQYESTIIKLIDEKEKKNYMELKIDL